MTVAGGVSGVPAGAAAEAVGGDANAAAASVTAVRTASHTRLVATVPL